MWLVLTYGSEKWVLIWKTGRRLTVVQVVTEWLMLWVTNRERICNSLSWATDSREQCNLEKHRTWNDPGQVTWLQEEMTERTSWWSMAVKGMHLGRSSQQRLRAPMGKIRSGLGWGQTPPTPEGKWRLTIFLGLSWCNFDLLAYIWLGASDTLLETLENCHLLIIDSLLWKHESKLNIVYFVPHNKNF